MGDKEEKSAVKNFTEYWQNKGDKRVTLKVSGLCF